MARSTPALPLPVALLRRRSLNAKSAKDRHDAVCFAWEVSVKLGVAAAPPADPTPLARGSFSQWAGCLAGHERPWQTPSLLQLYALLSEAGFGRKLTPASLPARRLLHALEAYRVRVLWSGDPLGAAAYDRAAVALREALDDAWRDGFFLQKQGRLLHVDSVQIDDRGRRRGRLFDLHGEEPLLIDPQGTVVPPGVEAGRLYLHGVNDWRPLYPWLVFVHDEEREHVYVLNGFWREHAEYLDYVTGEVMRGEEVEEHFPGLTAYLASLFERSGRIHVEAARPLEEVHRFGDYRILGELGRGGMGVVYLARQNSLGRHVALKRLPRALAHDPLMVGRFRREVAALGRCEHPNVVKILASGTEEGVPYYTMEFVQGADLAGVATALVECGDFDTALVTASERVREANEVLRRHVKPPGDDFFRSEDRYRRAARLFRDSARGVHHLHEHGILHRDLKPGNVMITADGQRAVIMDLGLAAVEDATTTLTRGEGEILGTLRYIAPELLQRHLYQVDRRADVYSLGATLYELVTDRPIFDGENAPRLIEQVLNQEPPAPDKVSHKVPRDLSMIVRKAIEKDPRLRYDNALELARDLDAFAEGRPISARPPSLGYVFRLAVQRNKALTLTAAAAVAVLVIGTFVFIQQLRRTSEREASLRGAAERNRAHAEDLVEFMLSDLQGKLRDAGRLDLLEEVARKAKAYYDALPAGPAPVDTRARRALALAEVGVILQNGAALAEAVECFEASLEEARLLPGDDARAAKLRFSAQRLLGDAYVQQGAHDRARRTFADALLLAQRSAEAHPDGRDWQRNLALAHERTGSHDKALDLYQRLADTDPEDTWARFHLSGAYEHRGHGLAQAGQPQAALAAYRKAREICSGLLAADPGNLAWKEILMSSEMKIGDALKQLGELPAALAGYEGALASARELARRHPANLAHQRSIALLQVRVGDVQRDLGRRGEAAQSYRDALVLRTAYVQRDKTNRVTLRELAVTHGKLADVLVLDGDLPAARGHHEAALDIASKLAASDPGYKPWQRLVAEVEHELATVLMGEGAPRRAREHYAAALRRLREHDPGQATRIKMLEESVRRVDWLLGGKTPATPAEHLLSAYAYYDTRDFARSTRAFREALADPKLRQDLDGFHLYNAGCSAARAGEAEQALAWLTEDFRLRRALLATAIGEQARRKQLGHFERARLRDPDLASLRGTPGFERLFD